MVDLPRPPRWPSIGQTWRNCDELAPTLSILVHDAGQTAVDTRAVHLICDTDPEEIPRLWREAMATYVCASPFLGAYVAPWASMETTVRAEIARAVLASTTTRNVMPALGREVALLILAEDTDALARLEATMAATPDSGL